MSDKCATTLPHQRAQTCPPSVVTEDKCAVIDCEYKNVKVTTTTFADCAKSVVIMDGLVILPPDTKFFACKEPTPVIPVCKPKTVFDREMVKLCHPDGTKVLVQDVTPEDAPLGTAPTLSFWTIAVPSVPYTGDTSLLKDCGAEKIDIAPAAFFCDAGREVTRTSVWDVSVSPAVLAGNIWQDIHGTVIAAPVASTLFSGQCKTAVYTERTICANTNTGKIWNMVERVTTNSLGVQSVSYLDPDTSPMVDVTSLFNTIRHGGTCECCADSIEPLLADLQLTKTSSPAQVFAGDQITFVITLTNLGPAAADGATITDNLPSGFQLTGTNVSVAGGAAGVTGTLPTLTVTTLPVGGSVTVEVTGTAIGNDLTNTATANAPSGIIEYPVGNNTDTSSVQYCEWITYHEILIPVSSLMGVYGSTANPYQLSNLGWVDPSTGVLTVAGSVPGANLNALGLDKATNNAVFIDRISGRIYTAYSPAYVITNPSVLQAGAIAAPNAILGALDSNQTWWVAGITGSNGLIATINVATVDPLTGIQTAVPSLTATLNSGSNGFDFDFAPNDDLYALVGLNIYLATKASGYAGWTLVGTLTGIPATAGSVAYDQGTLRGTSSTGLIWQFDLTTLTTVVTSSLPAGTLMADMSGATDPVCKRFYLNTCDSKFYELNKVVEYTPYGTPIVGDCQ